MKPYKTKLYEFNKKGKYTGTRPMKIWDVKLGPTDIIDVTTPRGVETVVVGSTGKVKVLKTVSYKNPQIRKLTSKIMKANPRGMRPS